MKNILTKYDLIRFAVSAMGLYLALVAYGNEPLHNVDHAKLIQLVSLK